MRLGCVKRLLHCCCCCFCCFLLLLLLVFCSCCCCLFVCLFCFLTSVACRPITSLLSFFSLSFFLSFFFSFSLSLFSLSFFSLSFFSSFFFLPLSRSSSSVLSCVCVFGQSLTNAQFHTNVYKYVKYIAQGCCEPVKRELAPDRRGS